MNNPTEMINVLYIYGYGSSPESKTCLALKELLYDANVISVNYTQVWPQQGIHTLEWAIEEYKIDLVIGSSLGGWYAMHVCTCTGKPCILINPVSDYTLIPTLKHVAKDSSWLPTMLANYKEYKQENPLFFPTMINETKRQLEEWDNVENGQIAWLIWSDEDEVIKYEEGDSKENMLDMFKLNISNKSVVKHGKHRLTNDELREHFVPAYEKLMIEIVPKHNKLSI